MINIDCPFCVELDNPHNSIWNDRRENLPLNRIIFENEHWVVMPPLGSFCVGGLLVLSKVHYPSCAMCPPNVLESLESILKIVKRVLAETYKVNVLFFEHGPSKFGTKGACCVDHAHINVFPIDFDIWNDLPKFPVEEELKGCQDIKKFMDDEYIWLIDNNHNNVYPVSGVPSQYIRTIITKHLGYSERWNWQDYLGLKEIQQTIADLEGKWMGKK